MHDRQPHGEHFPAFDEVVDVGAGEAAAGGAVAVLVERTLVEFILGVVHVDHALRREDVSVTGVAAGHDAVEEINPAVNGFEDIDRRADAHQITWLVLGHEFFHRFDDVIHDLGWFAHRQTADGVAAEVKLRDFLHILHADILVGAALVDAKEHLLSVDGAVQRVEPVHFRLAAFEPANGAVRAFFDIVVGRGIFHAFIKGHRDGGGKVRLDAHAFLRPHEDSMPVDV